MKTKSFLDEFKGFYPRLGNKGLKSLYCLDFRLVQYADTVIKHNQCINNSELNERKSLNGLAKTESTLMHENNVDFAALFLCGGKATRFGNIPKAIYEIKGLVGLGNPLSFLGLNVLQVLKMEKLS